MVSREKTRFIIEISKRIFIGRNEVYDSSFIGTPRPPPVATSPRLLHHHLPARPLRPGPRRRPLPPLLAARSRSGGATPASPPPVRRGGSRGACARRRSGGARTGPEPRRPPGRVWPRPWLSLWPRPSVSLLRLPRLDFDVAVVLGRCSGRGRGCGRGRRRGGGAPDAAAAVPRAGAPRGRRGSWRPQEQRSPPDLLVAAPRSSAGWRLLAASGRRRRLGYVWPFWISLGEGSVAAWPRGRVAGSGPVDGGAATRRRLPPVPGPRSEDAAAAAARGRGRGERSAEVAAPARRGAMRAGRRRPTARELPSGTLVPSTSVRRRSTLRPAGAGCVSSGEPSFRLPRSGVRNHLAAGRPAVRRRRPPKEPRRRGTRKRDGTRETRSRAPLRPLVLRHTLRCLRLAGDMPREGAAGRHPRRNTVPRRRQSRAHRVRWGSRVPPRICRETTHYPGVLT